MTRETKITAGNPEVLELLRKRIEVSVHRACARIAEDLFEQRVTRNLMAEQMEDYIVEEIRQILQSKVKLGVEERGISQKLTIEVQIRPEHST